MNITSPVDILFNWDKQNLGGVDNFTVTVVQSDDATWSNVSIVQKNDDPDYHFFSLDNVNAGVTYNVTVIANKGSESSSPVTVQGTAGEMMVF